MENKKLVTLTRTFNEANEEVGTRKRTEFNTFTADGAAFFLKEKDGFVISIYQFDSRLTSPEIERFNRIFYGRYVAKKTNRLEIPGTRRKFKEMDRAEIAEAMGFTGASAVLKVTTLLNKFIKCGVMAKKFNGRVEEWYVNPLLCKRSEWLSIDLFELFQDSITEAMATSQKMILYFLRQGLKEKYTSRVTTMTARKASEEIQKEQYKDSLSEVGEIPLFDQDQANTEVIESYYNHIKATHADVRMGVVPKGLSKEEMSAITRELISFILLEKVGAKEKAALAQAAKGIISF